LQCRAPALRPNVNIEICGIGNADAVSG